MKKKLDDTIAGMVQGYRIAGLSYRNLQTKWVFLLARFQKYIYENGQENKIYEMKQSVIT